ncbi:SsgA family sporulation/cell division regulator [Streptomyces sp. AS58]|uniref:SsgA family sporulation/cell division regulator n=1 Tax=Streptomyces sp. AS58 TaxID=1519489 RepID=UPI0006ADB0D4|nr:SsgA family sporulation/cell division regulator [Streptomyces sp. AS58]
MTGRETFDLDDDLEADHTAASGRKAIDVRRVTASRKIVTCRTLVRVAMAGEYLPVVTELRYDSADPYMVSFLFHADTETPVEWEFGRELLAAGQQQISGMGDVRIWPAEFRGSGTVFLSLRSGSQIEVIAASAKDIDIFLGCTHQVVPHGEEEHHSDIDGVVQRLLDQTP